MSEENNCEKKSPNLDFFFRNLMYFAISLSLNWGLLVNIDIAIRNTPLQRRIKEKVRVLNKEYRVDVAYKFWGEEHLDELGDSKHIELTTVLAKG
jgi:hypothetical protein